ncbi:nucleic acid/nucleotide deaminase domain-containing protein [Spirillospora sp. NPDC048819]|uniref:nucleic acid/nucleotide deaminase domain-containing protein n=1 Tax=Spirillospora sp. NPDC048819 TaxID=3155268 RepID=UPI0033FCB476
MAKNRGGSRPGGGRGNAAGAKVISKVLSETRTFRSRSGRTREYELIHPNKSREGPLSKKYNMKDRKDGEKGQTGPNVRTRKVDRDSNDLARAVDDARRHSGDKSGRNFAAFRYIDKNGEERIMVARSDGRHSEKRAGMEILERGGKLKEVYTERQPCDVPGAWCEEWIPRYFRNKVDVTYSYPYDNDIPGSKSSANSAVKRHAASL